MPVRPPPETVGDAWAVRRGDAGTVITPGDLAAEHGDPDDPAPRAPPRGVVEQVRDRARDPRVDALHRRGGGLQRELDLGVPAPDVLDRAGRDRIELHGADRQWRILVAGEIDEVRHEGRQTLDL